MEPCNFDAKRTASVVKIFSPTFSTQKQAISFCGVASSNNPYNSEQISVQELDVNALDDFSLHHVFGQSIDNIMAASEKNNRSYF